MKDEYDFSKGRRGPVLPPLPGTTKITLSVETPTLDWFRAQMHVRGGGDYQELMNTVLAQYVASAREAEGVRSRALPELRKAG